MTDHVDLVAEIPSVEKMATQDRLKHAKKRRSQQLKKWANYEKQLEKEHTKKSKKGQPPNPKKQRRTRNIKVRFKGNIMLLEAAARGDLEDVKRLLSAGVNPDVTNEDGLTALHQCCIDDNEEMLKLLLEFGAQVNARDSELWTPLHAAATCGHVHLCRHLIEKGAELLAVNADGNMPYDICEDEVTLDYIETEMAKRGVTQEEIDDTRLIPERQMLNDLKHIASKGGNLEFRDHTGATPLHVAAANGYMEVTNFLLDHHVSVDLRDYDSWQPIHAAACWLQPEILEFLVSNGADIDGKTRNGETAFDLCEDAEIKQKILDMKDEMETNKASRSKDNVRRHKHSSTRTLSNSSGSLYSSNTSLTDHHHRPTSASIRRSSMRGEKNPLFMKEAKEEALHFGWRQNGSGDEDLAEDEKENLPATNIDDIELRIDDMSEKLDREKDVRKPHNEQREHRESLSEKATTGTRPNRQNSLQNNTRSNNQPSSQTPSPNYGQRRSESEARSHHSPPQSESQVDRPRVPPDHHADEWTGSRSQRSEDYPSPKSSAKSFNPSSTPPNASGSASQPRYPSGAPSITLADLKRQRAESRSRENSLTDISSQVQNMFINSLNSNDSKKYSSSSLPEKEEYTNKNGHSTNNNTQSYIGHGENNMHRFKAPGNVPVVGGEEKQGCCVIL